MKRARGSDPVARKRTPKMCEFLLIYKVHRTEGEWCPDEYCERLPAAIDTHGDPDF
jgi:hypothetical protein